MSEVRWIDVCDHHSVCYMRGGYASIMEREEGWHWETGICEEEAWGNGIAPSLQDAKNQAGESLTDMLKIHGRIS
jgi:hypothetical protein